MFVKNCMCYVGSKDRLYPKIEENIDKSKETFIDLFSGSGVVGVNMQDYFKYVHLNDACWQVIRIIEYFRDNSTVSILETIDSYIEKFNLSKTNKEGYLKAREYFNETSKDEISFDPALLYALIMHSFSYNITFNSKSEFNVPAGTNRSYFTQNLRNKLTAFSNKMKISYPSTTSFKFDILLNVLEASQTDLSSYMIYADPPYYSSNNDAPYGRIYGLKWTETEERELYKRLDRINDMGGSFLLSNVVESKGINNKILEEWMKSYNVVDLNIDYNNCSYQRKNKDKETREVLVKNY